MKVFRPIELVTCCVCGEQFDKMYAEEIFTGRIRYMCPGCYASANKQMDGRRAKWRDAPREKKEPPFINRDKTEEDTWKR